MDEFRVVFKFDHRCEKPRDDRIDIDSVDVRLVCRCLVVKERKAHSFQCRF